MRSSSPAAPRRSARSRTGCPTPASRRSTGSSDRATPGSPPPRSRSPARSASTCRPGRRRAWSSPRRRPTRVAWPRTSSRRRSTAPTRPRSSSPRTRPSPTRSRSRSATCWPGPLRRDILERALRDHGRIALAPELDAAIDFINAYAPEHLSVDVEPLEPTVARIRNAGSLFVGPWAPESAGDYATGANHVLPTGGLARGSGGLAVEPYGKFVQVQRVDRDGLAAIRETIGTLAEAEGLLAHRDAVEIRFERSTAR